MNADAALLEIVRSYFDEVMYALLDFRLSIEAPNGPNGFPHPAHLRGVAARLDPSSQTIVRLFRLGEPVDGADVERAIPSAALDAFQGTGLLVRDAAGWRTPNLVLVPLEGLLILASTPASYPTSTGPCSVWFDLSSYAIARALPGSLRGARVLDICSGTGIQSLLCAARGAAGTVGLEISGPAVEVARINALLNGAGAAAEFRRSDGLAALGDDERFDFVVCNTPYAPVLDRDQAPASADAVGNSLLFKVLERLPDHLSPRASGILASWRSPGRGASSWHSERLAARLAAMDASMVTFQDRAPDTLEGVIKILRGDLEPRLAPDDMAAVVAAAERVLRDGGAATEGFFNEVITFRRGSGSERRVRRLREPAAAAPGARV